MQVKTIDEIIDDAARHGQELLAHGTQGGRARRSVQQPQSDKSLEALDPAGERGLGDEEMLCGAMEAPELGDMHEGLNAVDGDFHAEYS
jgi:cytosine/adenosine deaminase-related metal-dependent hydrolase